MEETFDITDKYPNVGEDLHPSHHVARDDRNTEAPLMAALYAALTYEAVCGLFEFSPAFGLAAGAGVFLFAAYPPSGWMHEMSRSWYKMTRRTGPYNSKK